MNKEFFNRMSRIAISIGMAVALFCILTQTALAYDASIHEVTDDLCWVVNNDVAGDYDASAALFMLVQPDSSYETARNYYGFDCTEGVFDFGNGYVEDSGTMQYWFMPMNKVVYDTIDEGEIWMWRFGLQNGKYIFAEPNGINCFYVLTSSLGSPFSEDGYTEGEEVIVENDYHPIYALYGDYEWAKENVDVMIEWAKKVEANRNNGKTSVKEEAEPVVETTVGEEMNDASYEPESVENETEEVALEETDTSDEAGHTEIELDEEQQNEEIEEPANKVFIVALILIVLIIAMVIAVICQRRKKR